MPDEGLVDGTVKAVLADPRHQAARA